MEKWRQHLRKLNPRIDLREAFYPEQLEPRHPALLSSGSILATGLIAARLLNIIAARGGTRIKSTWTRKMCALFEDALLPEAVIHCDDEVARILEWLEGRAETLSPDDAELDADQANQAGTSATPELDIMFASELESRLSVVRFALAENFDLQLEYFDATTRSWPRLRVMPLEILHIENTENTTETIQLNVITPEELQITIPLKSIRWLMPVTRHVPEPETPAPTLIIKPTSGRLLSFPNFSNKPTE